MVSALLSREQPCEGDRVSLQENSEVGGTGLGDLGLFR